MKTNSGLTIDFKIIVGRWIEFIIKWIYNEILVQNNLLLWTRSGLGGDYDGLTMDYGVLRR
jgi:hypothetical protein